MALLLASDPYSEFESVAIIIEFQFPRFIMNRFADGIQPIKLTGNESAIDVIATVSLKWRPSLQIGKLNRLG